MSSPKVRVLFSGYAPVHFLSFLPVYRQLEQDERIELWLSGGFRHKSADGEIRFLSEGFYDPFPVERSRVLPIEQAREQDFDVLVCSHLSDSLFPRSVERTVQIFHGVSFKNYAVREKALRFDLLCLPGRYHASRYREHGLIRNGSQVLLTGFAKMDQLVSGELRRDVLLARLGLDREHYIAKWKIGAPLPWDVVQSGVSENYFHYELKLAARDQTGLSCPPDSAGCLSCQACDPDWAFRYGDNAARPIPAAKGGPWRAQDWQPWTHFKREKHQQVAPVELVN